MTLQSDKDRLLQRLEQIKNSLLALDDKQLDAALRSLPENLFYRLPDKNRLIDETRSLIDSLSTDTPAQNAEFTLERIAGQIAAYLSAMRHKQATTPVYRDKGERRNSVVSNLHRQIDDVIAQGEKTRQRLESCVDNEEKAGLTDQLNTLKRRYKSLKDRLDKALN